MFSNYSSAFGDNAQRFGFELLKIAISELTAMSFVCFMLATKYGATDLFFPVRLRALKEDGLLRVSEEVLLQLP